MQHLDKVSKIESMKRQEAQLRQVVEFALQEVQKVGVQAEIGVTKLKGLAVSTRLGDVENIEFNSDGALGISIYQGQKKGNASTSDLSEQAIKETIRSALAIAEYTSEDPCSGLADKSLMAFNAPDLDLYHPTHLTVDEAIELAIQTEKYALDYDARIVNSDGATLNSHEGIRVYGNTHGMLQSYLSSRYSLSCSVIGEEQGELERDYEYSISREFDQLRCPQWIGENSAKKTLARLNPKKIKTQQVPVIFLNDVATGIISHLASAISGGSLYRKSSFLLDKLGHQILPEWFEIYERPHLLRHLASSPFDSEGVMTQDREIIQQGVLQTYLLTAYSAKKLGMQTTGHAGGIHNWLVKPNLEGGLETLLKQMDKGVLVTDLMGQGINLVTGDYSRGAAGFWVENGKIQYPIAEITLAGSLPEMFQRIMAISDDIEIRSNIQVGSLLIDEMKISGS